MKVYAMICKEIEIDDKFSPLIDYANYDDLDGEELEFDDKLHREFCEYIAKVMNLPLAGNAKSNDREWIESVLTKKWNCIIET